MVAINAAASTNKWGGGWRLVNKLAVVGASDKTYLEQNKLPPTIKINATPVLSELVFISTTGMITKTDGSLTDVVFSVCDSSTSMGVDVSMSRLGRVAVTSHTSSATCAL